MPLKRCPLSRERLCFDAAMLFRADPLECCRIHAQLSLSPIEKVMQMKRFVCILALFVFVLPAWSAKKMSVAELTDMLKSLHDQQKSDADVAAALKQVQLSEQLSRSKMNDLAAYAPGQLTTEQIYVLEARSALLPPPAADLPTTASPDAAAQKAILDKQPCMPRRPGHNCPLSARPRPHSAFRTTWRLPRPAQVWPGAPRRLRSALGL